MPLDGIDPDHPKLIPPGEPDRVVALTATDVKCRHSASRNEPIEVGPQAVRTPRAERLVEALLELHLDPRELVIRSVERNTVIHPTTLLHARQTRTPRLEPPRDPTGFIAAYHAAHPRHAHGAHHYTAASFGLNEHELCERFSFLDELAL
jgi:hypothetical protein